MQRKQHLWEQEAPSAQHEYTSSPQLPRSILPAPHPPESRRSRLFLKGNKISLFQLHHTYTTLNLHCLEKKSNFVTFS